MPTLKQLTCSIEWSASGPSLPLQEYGTTYFDGLVETYIAIPPVSTAFSVRLRSDGYIAPGLSMFIYIDGEYQCNRGRSNLRVPTSTTQKHHTNIDFVVRQKEESLPGGSFLGRQWTFGGLEEVSETTRINQRSDNFTAKNELTGVIEVVVLRSLELQRPKAPDPSISELHPLAFPYSRGTLSSQTTESSHPLEDVDVSDFEGIFDGASDGKERRTVEIPFGGDMAWDDDEEHNRGPHTSTHWSEGPQQNRGPSSHGRSRSRALSRSPPAPVATPAIQIFVTQPAANAPAPGSAVGPQQWSRPAGSVASWGSATSLRPSKAGDDRDTKSEHGWQTLINGAEKQQSGPPQSNRNKPRSGNNHNGPQQFSSSSSGGSKNMGDNGNGWSNDNDNNWKTTAAGSRGDLAPNVPGAWDATTEKAGHPGHHGWNNQGGKSPDWKISNDAKHENSGWNTDTNHQWAGQNSSGWGNNENNNGGNGHWDSARNNVTHQGGFDNSGNQNQEGWNSDHGNIQANNGWNGAGHNHGTEGQENSNRNATYNNSGNAWGNANTGSTEPQASPSPNWNTSTSNQNGWNQEGNVHDNFPATTGGSDPAKTRSRRASSGKVKPARSTLSQQASVNYAAQKSGWKTSDSVHGKGKGPVQSGTQHSGPPGAWPENTQNVPNVSIKPYHVVLDAVGNPTLPAIQHIVPMEAPIPAPPPVLADVSLRVQRGQPALYQHKTASPRYIDTHDKPYASFIFKYRPKAIIEQTLNLAIPESDQFEKAKLIHLSKEELIEQVIKAKVAPHSTDRIQSLVLTFYQSQLGSKAPSAVSNLGSVPPSVNDFAKGGNESRGVNHHGGAANQQNGNTGWYGGHGGHHETGNAGLGQPGGAFATGLNDKLAALAGQNHHSSSSSSSSINNNHHNNNTPAWNNPPLANNGNANFGGPSNGQAPIPPTWGALNNSKWNGQAAAGPSNGSGGRQVEAWISQTPVGASASGHKPWGGNSSMKNGGASARGGNAGSNAGNWEGNQANRGNSAWNGAWNGSNAGNQANGGHGGWESSQMNNNGANSGW
ncbi:MAG: hypothetical protein Q9200_003479 [Gallowayella weberi]